MKSGFPPKLIDTEEKSALLSNLGIRSGDAVHVEKGAPSSNGSPAPSSNLHSVPSPNQPASKQAHSNCGLFLLRNIWNGVFKTKDQPICLF